jgi:tetratricopeptide (TPR) repeat protein
VEIDLSPFLLFPSSPFPFPLFPLPSLTPMPTDELLAVVGRADELYYNRAQPGAVRESVMVLSGARGASDRYELQWRLARALFFLGQDGGSRDSSLELYSTGIAAGERAVALNSERVEGHFWVGVNLALFAEIKGGIRGARALRWARKELTKAASISESYHDAGPLRVLGRLMHKAPRILGGNINVSREYFERALALAPSNTVTLIYAAELATETGDRDRAATLLQRVLASSIDPAWEFESNRDRSTARSLLEHLSST